MNNLKGSIKFHKIINYKLTKFKESKYLSYLLILKYCIKIIKIFVIFIIFIPHFILKSKKNDIFFINKETEEKKRKISSGFHYFQKVKSIR